MSVDNPHHLDCQMVLPIRSVCCTLSPTSYSQCFLDIALIHAARFRQLNGILNKRMPAFLLSEFLLTVQPITQQLSGIMHLVSTLKLPYIVVYTPTEQRKQSFCQTDVDVVTRMRA